MGGRRRAGAIGRRGASLALLAALACAGGTGCLGPKAINVTRLRYNESVRSTNDEQLLMNIVRLRYADSPVFIDLPNITSQFELSGGGSYIGPNGQSNFGYGGLSGRDTPTLSYHPREGREIAKAMLTPLSADLFSVVNAGANTEQLLWMTINDINDVPNAPRATVLLPRVPDDNTAFLRGIRIIATLIERDAVELAVSTTEQSDETSDPISEKEVGGRDVLDAAKEGYVFRTRGDGRMTLLHRERTLVLRVRPRFLGTLEIDEMTRLFRLAPGLRLYKIRSELTEEATLSPPSPMGNDTIYLNMRSVLQIMTFLSKGVVVPPEHVVTGVAPSTPGPDGRPYDWTRITAGNFLVCSSRERPRAAEVMVCYRGYWFYIPATDVKSRAVLAILEVLFALQESDGKSVGPLLTLPLGG